MDTNTLLQSAQSLFTAIKTREEMPEPDRVDIYLPVENLIEAVQLFVDAGGWHLSAITGLDIAPTESSEGAIEILYHFCQMAAVVTLRIQVPYSHPEAPSVCCVIPAATLYERELIELFGVILEGTPVTDRLILPDDWPDGVYPLRKSFQGLE